MSNLSDDQARLAAQEMIAIGNSVQKAVQAMRLRGVEETQLDFYNGVYKKLDTSLITTGNSSCTDNTCKVYNLEGGKSTASIGPANAFIADQSAMPTGYWTAGHAGFRVLQIKNVGSVAPDLAMLFPFINLSVCKKINDIVGVTNPSTNPPNDTEGTVQPYSGNVVTFPNPAGFGLGDTANEISGKSMFCVRQSANIYYFWIVLLAR